MKSVLKKKAYLLIAVLVVAVSLVFPVEAFASPVILGLSTRDIKVGDTFTVSVAGAESSNLSLHYDGTMVTLTGQNGATLDGNTLTISAKSASFTFEAKQEGSAGFVASSDKYDRSSAVVAIAAADGTAATTDDTQTATDTADQDTSDDTSTTSTSADTSSVSDSTENVSSSTVSEDTDTVSAKHGVSSSDLSFRQLILDRRMILVIAILLAIIIVLIIRLTTLHYALIDEYGDDDIDFDDEEKKIADKEKEEEQKKLVEHVTEKKEKAEKKTGDIDLDNIDEEKLTMPKAPKKPNEKLKLEDLNNL